MMKNKTLIFFLACGLLVATGCNRSGQRHVAAEIRDRTAPAATYREGYGIQLSDTAARFVGLVTADVETTTDAFAIVPESSVLRTARGTFVFAGNGEWFLRTPVRTGETVEGRTVITEGLYEGDVVASRGVDALWLAEISAVNGGVGCADGH